MQTASPSSPAPDRPRPASAPAHLLAADLSRRACLVPLFSGELQTPEERLAWIEEQLHARALVLHTARDELAEAQAEQRERQWEIQAACHEVASLLVVTELERLYELRGCATLEGLLAVLREKRPGRRIGNKQLIKYLDIARYVPDAVVMSRNASFNALGDLAHVASRPSHELLCGLILLGEVPRNHLRRGAAAAREASAAGLPEEEVLARTRQALAAPQRTGRSAAAQMEAMMRRLEEMELRLGEVLGVLRATAGLDRRGTPRTEPDSQPAAPVSVSVSADEAMPSSPPPQGEGQGGGGLTAEPDSQPPAPAPEPDSQPSAPVSAPSPPPQGEGQGGGGLTAEPDSQPPASAPEPDSQPPAPAAEPEDEQQAWYTGVARAVVDHLQEGEGPSLQKLLCLTLAGQGPYPLVRFVRQVSERMSDVPPAVREAVEQWLERAAHLDLGRRWGGIYNFFVLAQLPGFQEHLHWLRGARLPAAQREVLETAWAFWPRPQPGPEPPPEGMDPALWAEWADMPEAALFAQEAETYFAQPVTLTAQAMGTAWQRARGLLDSLDAMEGVLCGLLGQEDGQPP